MTKITDALPTTAPDISSFGAGGQMYMADMWTGFNIKKKNSAPILINPLFAFSETDPVENASALTNLMEARKVGSTMAFRADRIGFRLVNFMDQNPTLKQVEELKQCLSSAVIEITVGSNGTKVAEFSGLSLMQPVDTVGLNEVKSESGATPEYSAAALAAVGSGLGGGIGWIQLQVPIEIQANVNIGGTVRFTRDPGANLFPGTETDPAMFGFVVILRGLKVVKS